MNRNHRKFFDLNLRLLRAFCPQQLLEEIEGDLLQKFERDLNRFSRHQTYWRLSISTLRFFRKGILEKHTRLGSFEVFNMIPNFFKISSRTLFKHKGFSAINILGLAIGMAAFLMIVQYVKFERSFEHFNGKASNIFRVTLDIYKGSQYVMTDCGMYAPIGPMLKDRLPEVLDFARMWQHGKQEVKAGSKVFYEEQIYFADPSAFEMFSFVFINGSDHKALAEPFQAVISESMARKYFGGIDVLGESMQVKTSLYRISGVISDPPMNTHLKTSFLLSHASLAKRDDLGYAENEFQGNSEYTYLLMADGVDLNAFNRKLKNISLALKDDIGDDVLVADRMIDIHLHSRKAYEPEPNSDARSVNFLLIVAIGIILIAWINYMNLSTASAIKRAKEVGIRKVMGSLRTELIWQFLCESTLITLVAAGCSLVMMYFALPVLNNVWGLGVSSDIWINPEFWYLFAMIMIIGSFFSGIYPAFVLSAFRPVTVLKRKYRASTQGQWVRKSLVVFQFTATALLVICVCTVHFQMNFLQTQDLGMNIERTLVIRSPTNDAGKELASRSDHLSAELHKMASVENVTVSGVLPGLSIADFSTTGNVYRPGKEKEEKGYIYYINPFDEHFIPTFQMTLLAGRNFKDHAGVENQLIINEAAVDALGFNAPEEAVGSKVFVYNQEKTIIGVLRNFRQQSAKEKHIPMVGYHSHEGDYFSLKFTSDNVTSTVAFVKSLWIKTFPNSAFDYFFLEQRFDQQYKSDQKFGQILSTFSILSVAVACLGLFGLASYTVAQRTKEIGIRKILGSTITQVLQLLSQDFIKLVIIAGTIAIPFGYFVMEDWLANFSVRITMSIWIFAVPLIIIVVLSMVTISFQTIAAARANPADSIKHE